MIKYHVVCYSDKDSTPFLYCDYPSFDAALVKYKEKLKDMKRNRIDIMKVNIVDNTSFEDYRKVVLSSKEEQLSLFDAI